VKKKIGSAGKKFDVSERKGRIAAETTRIRRKGPNKKIVTGERKGGFASLEESELGIVRRQKGEHLQKRKKGIKEGKENHVKLEVCPKEGRVRCQSPRGRKRTNLHQGKKKQLEDAEARSPMF